MTRGRTSELFVLLVIVETAGGALQPETTLILSGKFLFIYKCFEI